MLQPLVFFSVFLLTQYFELVRDNQERFFGDEYFNLEAGEAGRSYMLISVGSSLQPTQNLGSEFLKCPLIAKKSPFYHQNQFLM